MSKLIILFAIFYVVSAAEDTAEPVKTEVQDTKSQALPAASYTPFTPYSAFPYQTPFADPYVVDPYTYQFGQLGYPYYSGFTGYPGIYESRNQRSGFPYTFSPTSYTVPGVQNAHVVSSVPAAYYDQAYFPGFVPRADHARSSDTKTKQTGL